MGAPRLAAIDVGSNGLRLRIAEVDGAREVLSARVPVRLGHDSFRRGALSTDTLDAAVEGLRSFRRAMRDAGVGAYRAVATSATREARNAGELIRRARKEADIELEIIDGFEEADLVRIAVQGAMGIDRPTALVDLGGGSTEITTLDERRQTASATLHLGTVRMLGEFHRAEGRVPRRTVREIEDVVRSHLRPIRPHLRSAEKMIATGGTARAFVRLCRRDEKERIGVARMERVADELRLLTKAGRIDRYGMRDDRADTIVMAGIVLTSIAKTSGVSSVDAPAVGLRDGVLAKLAHAQRRVRRIQARTLAA